MTSSYFPVEDEVIKMAKNLVEAHHPYLEGATINIVYKEKAARSGGRLIVGKSSKVSPKVNATLASLDKGPIHFIIVLAADVWETFRLSEQIALLDHQLTHCYMIDGAPKLRAHDIEEFFSIVERHGAWQHSIQEMDKAIESAKQAELFNAKLDNKLATTITSLHNIGAELSAEYSKALPTNNKEIKDA